MQPAPGSAECVLSGAGRGDEAGPGAAWEVQQLGRIAFDRARQIQEQFAAERIAGDKRNLLIICEHPPTISLGRRSTSADEQEIARTARDAGIALVRCDRGGLATYHGPGQLVFYPVVSLPQLGWGVKTFVERFLALLASAAADFGIPSEGRLCPLGLWTTGTEAGERKIAACGLRIIRGVTLHGFSLNVCCDLAPFRLFSPCGLPAETAGSMAAARRGEQGDEEMLMQQVAAAVGSRWCGGQLANKPQFARDYSCAQNHKG